MCVGRSFVKKGRFINPSITMAASFALFNVVQP